MIGSGGTQLQYALCRQRHGLRPRGWLVHEQHHPAAAASADVRRGALPQAGRLAAAGEPGCILRAPGPAAMPASACALHMLPASAYLQGCEAPWCNVAQPR